MKTFRLATLDRLLIAVITAGAVWAAVFVMPRNIADLRALERDIEAPSPETPAAWQPCAGADAAALGPVSVPLAVASRLDCGGSGLGALTPRDEVDALWIGIAQHRRGRHADAIETFRRRDVGRFFATIALGGETPERPVRILFATLLQALHPDDWRILFRSAQQLREAEPASAIAPLQRAAELHPSHEVFKELGLVSARLSRFADAARYYARAQALQPGDLDVLQSLGEAEYYAGRPEASQLAFLEKQHLAPADAQARFWLDRIATDLAAGTASRSR